MPQIQFTIPDNVDKEIRIYMIEHNLKDKRIAIIEILKKLIKK